MGLDSGVLWGEIMTWVGRRKEGENKKELDFVWINLSLSCVYSVLLGDSYCNLNLGKHLQAYFSYFFVFLFVGNNSIKFLLQYYREESHGS